MLKKHTTHIRFWSKVFLVSAFLGCAIFLSQKSFFLKPRIAHAAGNTIVAASSAESDVAAAIATASNGDTVQIPCSGSQSVTWTSQLSVSKSITITGMGATPNTGTGTFGVGTNCLTIRDDAVNNDLFFFTPTYAATNNVTVLQNINIDPFSTATALCNAIDIIGQATASGFPQARIDNIGFGMTTPWSESGNGSCGAAMIIQDDVIGVADHNTIPPTSGFGIELMDGNFSSYLGVGQFGDNSWAQPDSMGGPNNWFNENNNVTITTDMVDCEKSDSFADTGGCRYVNRFNHVTMPGGFQISGVHGLDTGGRFRSGRHTETYGNTLACTGGAACQDFASFRGGTGVVWGNTATVSGGSFFSAVTDLTTYRAVYSPTPWNGCGGLNSIDPWDTNDNQVYFSGTASNGGASLTFTDNSNTFGNLAPAGAPYSVYDVTQNFISEVVSNTAHTITILNPISESSWYNGGNGGVNNGDSYQVIRSTVCMDQGGRGAGNYISGLSPTPVGPINEVLDPVYEWDDTMPANTVSYNIGGFSGKALINRDYYTENVKGAPVQQTSQTSPFDGSGSGGKGVGWGTLANRPTTCTPGVGYWATDQGNWNQSGSGGQGELFTCGPSANTWSVHYEPYAYPHPLIALTSSGGGGGGTTNPSAPTGLTVTGTTTSTVSLSWSAATAGTYPISGYDVYKGGVQIGTTASTNYTATGLSASTGYTFTVAAYDTQGNTSAQSGSVNATTQAGGGDVTPPTVSLTAPANNATVSGSVTISANASDNVAVASVSFMVDGTVVGTDTTSPYTFSWNSASVSNGTHVITAKATDTSGNTATSGSVTVTVSNSSGGGGGSIALIQATSTTGDGCCSGLTSQATFGSNTTAGDLIVVNVMTLGGPGYSAGTISDTQGDTFTLATSTSNSNGNTSAYLYYTSNIKGGSDTVSFAWANSATRSYMMAISEYSGVAATNPLDQVNQSVGGSYPVSSIPTGNVTTGSANELLYTFTGYAPTSGTTIPTVSSGWAETIANTTNALLQGAAANAIAVSAGTYSNTFSGMSAYYGFAYIAAFRGSGSGGGGGDTTPPTASISSPLNNATVSSTISISGTASDNVSVSSVAVSIDGGAYQAAQGTTSWTYSLNTTGLSNGTHTIVARAIDSSGNAGNSGTVTVNVNNGSGGGTITAATCNESDVQTAVSSVATGGTVIIPAGTCTWTTSLSVTKGITLTGSGTPNSGTGTFGAGTPTTEIIDNNANNPPFIVSGLTTGQTFRMSLLDIEPESANTSLSSPVNISGVCNAGGCPLVRLDNLIFGKNTPWNENGNSSNAGTLVRVDNVFGVADHDTLPTGSSVEFINISDTAYLGVGNYGDNSWAQPDTFGEANNFFLENNNVTNGLIVSESEYAPTGGDGQYGGSRYVARFNDVADVNNIGTFGYHGLDTGGRDRSGRQLEAYGNSVSCAGFACGAISSYRGGTGFTWGNTLIPNGGFINSFTNLVAYRNVYTSPGGWGACGGSSPYDTNDGVVYYSGTVSAISGSPATVMTDNTKTWTTNQFTPPGEPYSVYDVTQGWWAEVWSNTANTITIMQSIPEQNNQFAVGDSYQILRATVCADQGGRGQGNYVSGAPASPAAALNEALDPVYEWDDTDSGGLGQAANLDGAWTSRFLDNRDYYTDWSLGAPHAQTSPTSPFNGTGANSIGIGFGTLANRPTSCTKGVGYWATDQGNWNQSGNGFGSGELFVCTGSNAWTMYYQPFTYPYPLTAAGLPNPSAGSGGGSVDNGFSGSGDTTPPTTSITSPANNATVSSTISVTATASDNVGVTSVQLYIDGSLSGTDTTSPYTFSLNTTSLSNGSHTLQTKAYDAAGNVGSSASISVTINNVVVTKPSITSSLSATATTTLSFSYQITASNSPTSYNATNLPAGLSVNTSSGLISGTPTSAGTTNITISATNSGGTGSATLVLTVSNSPDTTPPSVPTNLSVSGTTTSTASLSWSASTDPTITGQTTSGMAGYKIYRGGVQIGTSVTNSFTNTGLAASTTYAYTVAAYDNAGNVSNQSTGVSASTKFLDTIPPTVSLTAPANNATVSGSVTISATASDNIGVTSVQFKLDGQNIGNPVTSAPYQVFWNSIGSVNGTHTLTAIASDAAGNQGTAATVTATVNNVVTPAITSALSASATAGSSFSYTITASNNPTSYGASSLPSGLSVNTATGLISGNPASAGTYNITISATNSAGTGSATLVLTVTNAVDTTPPTVPQNLTLTAKTTSTVSLSWSASTDNFAVAGYKVYRCTGSSCSPVTQVGTTANVTYVDTSLTPQTIYTYAVSAYDAAGNNSVQSADVLAATQALPDTTPPTTSISSPISLATISGNASPVVATASDNVGVVKVELYVDGILKATDTTSPYTFSVDTTQLANGTHTLQTKAYDAAGNVGPSTVISVTVFNVPQTLTASLAALPLTGIAPLSVSLTATTAGTAQGTLNYIFYCNRSDTGTNITSPSDLTVSAATSTSYTASNLCSYQTAGSYTTKVIVEQGSAPPAQAQQTVVISNPVNQSSTPLISNVTVGQITDTSAQVTVVTTQSSSIVLDYGPTTSYGSATLASPNLSTVFVNLGNLTQNTQYDFDVVAIAQGTTTPVTSQNFTFTTQATQSSGGGGGGSSGGGGGGSGGGGSSGGGGGGSSPSFSVSASVTTTTATTAAVTVKTSVSAKTQLFYGISLSYGSTTLQSLPQTTSYFNLAGLTAGKAYHLKAVSIAEGITESSPDITFIPGQTTSMGGGGTGASSTTTYPPFTRNLTVGSTGADVTELQTLLVQWGYLKTAPTGYYGNLTKLAVKAFQKANGIQQTGTVGPVTRAKLNQLIGAGIVLGTTAVSTGATTPSATTAAITTDLTLGSSGSDVTLLQTLLTKDGDYTGPITGYYGNLTEQAVETFQTKYGIATYGSPETTGYGAVGPKTREDLGKI